MKHLSSNDIKQISLPVPPLPEQRAIAAYLDHKTAQLDTLLAQKETLLRLLHQKRQALINEAVTQGLDPAAPRRSSGVALLGEVPAHWQIKKVSLVADVKGRIGWKGYTVEDLTDAENGVLVLGATQINKLNKVDLSKSTYLTYEKYEESPEIKLETADIIVVKVGATIGKVALIPNNFGPATINPNVMIVKAKGVLPAYLYYYLCSNIFKAELDNAKSAGAQDAINQEFMRAVKIPIPPMGEQNKIAEHLDYKTGEIDNVVKVINTQIKTLKAYRQSLISEVVTGKVDVRTEAQALAGTAPTPSPTKQASQPTPARPASVGQLNLF